MSPPPPDGPLDGDKGAELREAVRALREKNFKILIIDDETKFRASMKELLVKAFNADVVDVESGFDGIADVGGGNSYDVVFLDLMMPGMSGNETYAELMKLAPSLCVVFMSAYSSSTEWERAVKTGVTVLHKPIPLKALVQVLSQYGGARP